MSNSDAITGTDHYSFRQVLFERLRVLMFSRVLFVSLILGTSLLIRVREFQSLQADVNTSYYILLASVYFISIMYAYLLKRLQNLSLLAYIQLLLDTVFITVLIYISGGIESIFSFLYVLSIISGSIILYRKGGLITASGSSILYGLVIDLQYYGVIHPLGSNIIQQELPNSAYLFFTVLIHIGGFFLVGYLSGLLAEQVKKSRIELQATQEDLSRLEVLQQSIIDSIASGLIVLDNKENVILFNPAAEELFEKKAYLAFERPVCEILPSLETHLQNSMPPAENRKPAHSEAADIDFPRSDGSITHLRLYISSLKHISGDQKGRILVFQDVTQIKKIEEEKKRVEGLALVGELAASIAHEIRNPMASISGSIEILKDEIIPNNINNRLIDIISREIERLNRLVNDFLLFARPGEIRAEKISIDKLIMGSVELIRNNRNWNQNIKIFTKIHQHTIIKSDPDQLKQVLWNLLINAVDAMETGGELHIETSSTKSLAEKEAERIRITVRDTGSGFNEESLAHLFTPFFTTKKKGSGLGLAIVKRIMDRLHGEIYGGNHPEGGGRDYCCAPCEYEHVRRSTILNEPSAVVGSQSPIWRAYHCG